MAYVFIDRTINSNNNEIALGVSISNSNSLFNSLYDLRLQVRENLKTLLLTRKGERYMSPTFGTDLLDIIFQPNVEELKQDVYDIIAEAINVWIPKIQLVDIKTTTNVDDTTLNNTVLVSITYSIVEDIYIPETLTIQAQDNGSISVM